MADWLDSDANWPAHDSPQWSDTIELAREHGWFFRPASGHPFGTIACKAPPGAHGDDVCSVPIYSTGRGSENVARDTRKRILKCGHRGASDELPEEDPARVSALLREIRTLLDGAERLIDAMRDARAASDAVVDAIQASTDRVDALLVEATHLESRSIDAQNVGAAILHTFGPAGESPGGALDAADGRLGEAEASQYAPSAEIGAARARSHALRDRLARVTR